MWDLLDPELELLPADVTARPLHVLMLTQNTKRVAGYPDGPVQTGKPGLTARVRQSPHFLNASDRGNLFGLMAAVSRAKYGGSEQADQLGTHLQSLLHEQDGHNAFRDDGELVQPPAGSRLMVILWGGNSPFQASLVLARQFRAAYPDAIVICAFCSCGANDKCQAAHQLIDEGIVNHYITFAECDGAEGMAGLLEGVMARWPS